MMVENLRMACWGNYRGVFSVYEESMFLDFVDVNYS